VRGVLCGLLGSIGKKRKSTTSTNKRNETKRKEPKKTTRQDETEKEENETSAAACWGEKKKRKRINRERGVRSSFLGEQQGRVHVSKLLGRRSFLVCECVHLSPKRVSINRKKKRGEWKMNLALVELIQKTLFNSNKQYIQKTSTRHPKNVRCSS